MSSFYLKRSAEGDRLVYFCDSCDFSLPEGPGAIEIAKEHMAQHEAKPSAADPTELLLGKVKSDRATVIRQTAETRSKILAAGRLATEARDNLEDLFGKLNEATSQLDRFEQESAGSYERVTKQLAELRGETS